MVRLLEWMQQRRARLQFCELGRTGSKVSAACLGTMTFGDQRPEAVAFAQMDMAVDVAWSEEMERRVNAIRAAHPDPCP